MSRSTRLTRPRLARAASTGRRTARPSASQRPLAGRSILVTRPRAQNRALCDRLRALGARVSAVPMIDIVPAAAGGPLDAALQRLGAYDWIVLTSANGARACLARAAALGIDLAAVPRLRWAAVGPATAAVLRRARITVHLMPSRYLTEAISAELPDARESRILLPRTDVASPDLADALRRRGAVVDAVAAYRTIIGPHHLGPRIRRLFERRGVDVVVFTSPSTVRGLLRLLGAARHHLERVIIACIGPVTAAAVADAGLRPGVVAREYTIDGLIEALLEVSVRGQNRVAR